LIRLPWGSRGSVWRRSSDGAPQSAPTKRRNPQTCTTSPPPRSCQCRADVHDVPARGPEQRARSAGRTESYRRRRQSLSPPQSPAIVKTLGTRRGFGIWRGGGGDILICFLSREDARLIFLAEPWICGGRKRREQSPQAARSRLTSGNISDLILYLDVF
jgi:hypothetical protein